MKSPPSSGYTKIGTKKVSVPINVLQVSVFLTGRLFFHHGILVFKDVFAELLEQHSELRALCVVVRGQLIGGDHEVVLLRVVFHIADFSPKPQIEHEEVLLRGVFHSLVRPIRNVAHVVCGDGGAGRGGVLALDDVGVPFHQHVHLRVGDGVVRTELAVAVALDKADGGRPFHVFAVPLSRSDVGEAGGLVVVHPQVCRER